MKSLYSITTILLLICSLFITVQSSLYLKQSAALSAKQSVHLSNLNQAKPTQGLQHLPFDSVAIALLEQMANPLLAKSGNVALKAANLAVEQPQMVQSNDDLAVIDQLCTSIGLKLASVSRNECLALQMQPSSMMSIKNRALAFKEYPPLNNQKSKAKVLLLGGVHGDELTSISVTFKWMTILNQHHSGLFHWLIAPVVNPDALLIAQSTRYNASGVDINRNFPTKQWQFQALKNWQQKYNSNPRFYPGVQPASEPETQWVMQLIKQFQPDIIIAIHAPYGLIDIDGNLPLPKKMGTLKRNILRPHVGSLGNFASTEWNIPVLTIELRSSGTMPSVQEYTKIWTDLIKWLEQVS